jgi:hypothetical protein
MSLALRYYFLIFAAFYNSEFCMGVKFGLSVSHPEGKTYIEGV